MRYVDGFVLPIKTAKIDEYKKMAQEAGEIWKKHGALLYMECRGDDVNPDMGEHKPLRFSKTVEAKEDETVFFSFIVYESRAHRDEVNKKVMADPFMNDPAMKEKEMPFDIERMAYAGFEAVVDIG